MENPSRSHSPADVFPARRPGILYIPRVMQRLVGIVGRILPTVTVVTKKKIAKFIAED
jgi:hypothetical protein